MFHWSLYHPPRTSIHFYAIESFLLSARVGESLANCLSILSVTASSESNDIFSSVRWNDLYPQKQYFIAVFIFRYAPQGRLLYCRLKRRSARNVVKILMACLVPFSINRDFNNEMISICKTMFYRSIHDALWNFTAVNPVDRRRLVVFVSAAFRSVTTRCEVVLLETRWSQWLKRTV